MKNIPVILIVEDEEAIAQFLAVKLESSGYRTLRSGCGKDALIAASSHCPDLILLDLGLPDMDGMEVLTAIRSWSMTPIIIISARQGENFIVTALDQGADDYITKPFSNSILMARVRTALRKGHIGKIKANDVNQSFQVKGLFIDYDKRQVMVDDAVIHLTPIEYRIIVLLALNAGTVLTHEFLCRELWGPYIDNNKTLRVNVANLRRKIESNTAEPKYILTEIGVGYRMAEEVQP